jgi:hypothetical protein
MERREKIVRQRLAALPAGDRARRYREMAGEAFQHASDAQSEVLRAEYLSLASSWQVLAIEIEHATGLATPANSDDVEFPSSSAAR